MEKYSTYKCADFASDQAFINWVRNPDPESDAFWTTLITLHPELKSEVDDARLIVQSMQFEEKELSRAEIQALWNMIETDVHTKKRTIVRHLIVVAACAASVAVLLGVWRWTGSGAASVEPDQLTEFAVRTAQVIPGNDVQVILADKSSYMVNSDHAELQYDEKGQIIVNAKDVIDQQVKDEKTANEVKFNQVMVPWGKRTTISFADGTKLWLNAGSRAVYPVEFASNQREVFIEGEAYFEVTEDKTKPFIVKTGKIEINVLGTKFNVNTYPQENDISVALLSGSVAVVNKNKKTTHLQPNQIMIINSNTSEQVVRNADIYDYICWKEGLLQFKSEALESVLRKVERHYAIPVSIETSFEEYRITGKLDLKENIGEVLKIIEKLAPIQYEINSNKVFIHKKKSL